MVRTIAAMATAFVCVSAHAVSWEEISSNPRQSTWIDTDSLKQIGPDLRLWAKIVLAKPDSLDADPKHKFTFIVELVKVNCEEETFQTQQTTFYAADGSSVANSTLPGQKSVVAPETSSAHMLEAACRMWHTTHPANSPAN